MLTEYEEVLQRESEALKLAPVEIKGLLDDLCTLAERHHLKTEWQPILSDPADEAFVHLAWEARADCLVTHNLQHFSAARQREIRVVTPKEFLTMVRSEL